MAEQNKRRKPLGAKLLDFCGATCIHGFHYFPCYRNRGELGFWIATVVVAFIFCVLICYGTYQVNMK